MKRALTILIALSVLLLSACGGIPATNSSTSLSTTQAATSPSSATTESKNLTTIKWPERNVQITVPYKAGGGVDQCARLVSSHLEKLTGKAFVITNKPEGNGIIAINELKNQKTDGYNLMVVSNRDLFGHIVNKIEGVEYNKESFTYIATLLESTDLLLASSEKYASFDAFLEKARQNPGKVTIATANTTGLQSLTIINEVLGVEFSGVSYSSGADAYADLLGGHIDAAMVASTFYTQAKGNGLFPLVTLTSEKYPIDDLDVPCIGDYGAEAATNPMFRFLLGPAGMDPALVEAIVKNLDQVYTEGGDLTKTIQSQYNNSNYKTGQSLADFVNKNFKFRLDQSSS